MFKITIFLSIGMLALSNANAFFFGAKSFEECVSNEMKGRAQQQLWIVKEACWKKFPSLKSYTNINKRGTLICSGGNSGTFNLDVAKDTIGGLTITRRNSEVINAEDAMWTAFDGWGKGTRLTLNLESGEGLFYSIQNNNAIWNFSCSEK